MHDLGAMHAVLAVKNTQLIASWLQGTSKDLSTDSHANGLATGNAAEGTSGSADVDFPNIPGMCAVPFLSLLALKLPGCVLCPMQISLHPVCFVSLAQIPKIRGHT